MLNPITDARVSQHLSINALSKALILDRSYITRAEQGCYSTPGKVLTQYAAKTLELAPQGIQSRYLSFQHAKRMATLKSFVDLEGGLERMDIPTVKRYEPHKVFRNWREQYWPTVTGFCVAMCCHPYSVAQYEDGKIEGMPVQLQDIMHSYNLINPEIDVRAQWHDRRTDKA